MILLGENMYKNNINKKLNNTQLVYSTMNKNNVDIDIIKGNKMNDSKSIDTKINEIFNSVDYVYKADVHIVTDSEILNKRIVARNHNNLITFDNEYIPISIIRDIYK